MARFTVRRLREDIEGLNDWLAYHGSLIRFETGGRNGYQAVDEYSVDADGARVGSGVNRNVCCGTSNECSAAAWAHYRGEMARMKRAACTCGEG